MLIAIPSKSRPFKLKSKEFLKSSFVYVPENEFQFYNKIYPNNVLLVPDEIKGITATRNYILRNTSERYVVFVDDDLKKVGYWKDTEDGRKFINIDSEKLILKEFEKLFNLTESMGYKIWGVKTEASKISQHDEKPILFQTYITASCMGIINDGSYYFNEEYKLKEDYEICLRHIKKEGGIIGAKYITWENEHWGKNGGCGDYRNDDMEKNCINKLIKEYPEYVRKVERKNSKYCISLYF